MAAGPCGGVLLRAVLRVRGVFGAAATAAAVMLIAGCVQLPPMLQPDEPAAKAPSVPAEPIYRTAPAPPTALPLEADEVLVVKSTRRLMLLHDGQVLRSYRVALGSDPVGDKLRDGDGRTPEGHYVLDWRKPDSEYYRAIHISYPDPLDVAQARAAGLPPGDSIMIHGLPENYAWLGARHARYDWTEGCIAVSNAEMDEIWRAVDDGTPIEIRP